MNKTNQKPSQQKWLPNMQTGFKRRFDWLKLSWLQLAVDKLVMWKVLAEGPVNLWHWNEIVWL